MLDHVCVALLVVGGLAYSVCTMLVWRMLTLLERLASPFLSLAAFLWAVLISAAEYRVQSNDLVIIVAVMVFAGIRIFTFALKRQAERPQREAAKATAAEADAAVAKADEWRQERRF
jgi:hypothetical protein